MADAGLEIKKLVEEMKLYNQPEELEKTRSFIRKNVPLSMRGYLLAYLYLKMPRRKENAQHIENGNAASLYISVGKNSRANAKELASFIVSTAKVSESDIYGISFKQNYSFVSVKKELAKSVIEKVNGQEFRGRKVKINFSKEKEQA